MNGNLVIAENSLDSLIRDIDALPLEKKVRQELRAKAFCAYFAVADTKRTIEILTRNVDEIANSIGQ